MLDALTWDSVAGTATESTTTVTYASAVTLTDTDPTPWTVSGDLDGPKPITSVSQVSPTEIELTSSSGWAQPQTATVTYSQPPRTVRDDATGAYQGDQTDTGPVA